MNTGTILINTECARDLELVSNSIERKSKNSLLGEQRFPVWHRFER